MPLLFSMDNGWQRINDVGEKDLSGYAGGNTMSSYGHCGSGISYAVLLDLLAWSQDVCW